MGSGLNRNQLDHLAAVHSLDPSGVEALLRIAQARPGRAEARRFLAQCLRISGVLSLAAGVVFFIAANWSRFAILGRFALLELLLLGCAVVAWLRPPPSFAGRGALFLAFITAGALLALFGQTYQTGADIYELFLTWALLGLPLAWLSRWSATSAAWILVFNLALLLYCGWQPDGGLFRSVLGGRRFLTSDLVAIAGWLNLALWLLAEWRQPDAVPAWVRRLLVTFAFLFLTWAGIYAVVRQEMGYAEESFEGAPFQLTPLALFSALAVTTVVTLRQRRDVYPLALAMGSVIAVTFVWLVKIIDDWEAGVFLLLAVYLVIASTVAGRVLLGLLRRWRQPPST